MMVYLRIGIDSLEDDKSYSYPRNGIFLIIKLIL